MVRLRAYETMRALRRISLRMNQSEGWNRARKARPKVEARAPEDHPDQRLEREREELSLNFAS